MSPFLLCWILAESAQKSTEAIKRPCPCIQIQPACVTLHTQASIIHLTNTLLQPLYRFHRLAQTHSQLVWAYAPSGHRTQRPHRKRQDYPSETRLSHRRIASHVGRTRSGYSPTLTVAVSLSGTPTVYTCRHHQFHRFGFGLPPWDILLGTVRLLSVTDALLQVQDHACVLARPYGRHSQGLLWVKAPKSLYPVCVYTGYRPFRTLAHTKPH